VVLGMSLIGLICGWVGAGFNTAQYRTVTRVLVTVITVKQLIVGFESAVSDSYVVWLRSLAGIGMLHLAFARLPAVSQWLQSTPSDGQSRSDEPLHQDRMFPNLLT
jgi:hypothetical protein